MEELLLADANQLSASPSEYEATQRQIESAVYETFTLREGDFNVASVGSHETIAWCKVEYGHKFE